MNLTVQQLKQIIKEELESVLIEKKKKKKKKKDACYRKVKRRYKVWPSAYASGALVKCRKVGAKNWGNKSKKNETLDEVEITDKQIGGKYDGKPCAIQPGQKTKPKCASPEKAASMTKKQRDSAAKRKRKQDPNPNRKGKAKNVNTDPKKESLSKIIEQVIEEMNNELAEAEIQEKKNSKCTKVTKKASSTRKGKKWMKCVKSDSGGYKRIHWGQKGVRVTGKSGNTKRKKSFKARHNCSKAKSNTPQGQACKDWAE
jgi:hypothetical protein